MKWIKGALVALTLAAAVGCAALQSTTTLTPNEQEAAVLVGATTAVQTGQTLYDAGKISKADFASIVTQSNSVVAVIKAVRSQPASTDPTNQLLQAAQLLATLQTFVTSKETP